MLEYSLTHWLTFFSAAFILTLSPRPNLAFILAQTIRGGRKSGFAAMLGIWGGTLVHIILAIIGLSAVITASAWWSDRHWWVSKINGGGEGIRTPEGSFLP